MGEHIYAVVFLAMTFGQSPAHQPNPTGRTPGRRHDEGLLRNGAVAPGESNYCAGQIGVHEPEFRSRCIKLGETLGLYKDKRVSKNCTPSYLPEFIRIEVAKRK